MKLRLIAFISGCLLFFHPARSQDSIRCGSWVCANIHYGFIIPAYSSMDILIKAHVPAMELDYLNKPLGMKPWQQAYHCPEMGVAFFYGWLGNPSQLGDMIGAYPFLNFHLQSSYKETLYLRVGMGLAYMPVTFDELTNHKNNVIGSHINSMLNLRLTTHFYLSDKMRIEAGLGVTHTSDGNFTTPNLGINLLTVNTGLSYCIKPGKSATLVFIDSARKRKPENEFIVGVGLSQIEPPDGPHYGAITLSYMRYYTLSSRSKLGGGLDVFYNNANIASMASDSIYLKSPFQNVQFGIKASYEFTINKLSLPLELGGYLYTQYKNGGYVYDRIGLRYYANKHLITNLTLLLHIASAVYIEWGVGYRF
jgi:hypothetical protein